MNDQKHPRAVIGLILLSILCTMALGLQERRSAPLAAYSPASPPGSAPPGSVPRPLQGLRTLELFQSLGVVQRVGTRAFWLGPWPWVVVGLIGFGLLAWVLVWGVRRMERD